MIAGQKAVILGLGILLAILGLQNVNAQKVELGVGLGGFNYNGDIAPSFQFRNIRPGGSLFFRYNFNSAFTMRAEVAGGLVGAKDSNSKDPYQLQRNLSFRTRIFEASAAAEYNFLDFKERRFAVNWTPYVFGGIGLMKFTPDVVTSSYKTNALVIPYGVGIKYQLKRPWGIGLEYGTRKAFTDYIDNLGGEPTSTNKAIQGNPALSDKYYYIRFSLTYTFYTIFCP